jgi:uncharacterized protein (DUF2141 family)
MSSSRFLLATLLVLLGPGAAHAADLVVKVTGIRSDTGEVGCALYARPDGFPLESGTTGQWHPARKDGVECRFPGLKRGVYAVAVVHDTNGNHRTDLLGIPTEDWGVSNNVHPSLRAPTFDEAQVGSGNGTW